MKRGLLALVALALAAPLAASAGGENGSARPTYLAPALSAAAATAPEADVHVIVQGESASDAENVIQEAGGKSIRPLGIVNAAAGSLRAGDLARLANKPGLTIIPDEPVVLDANSPKDDNTDKPDKGKEQGQTAPAFSSSEIWPAAVGVDQLWPQLASRARSGPARRTPAIAVVDSGIEASRSDFAGRVLAQVDLTSLPDNSAGDGNGHGTFVAGLAAGSAPGYAGADPTAGIVSLDVMNDQGMARTSDVIAAAQWIIQNREQYDIRVANFSLHSASESSFRWDPLDKAVEKLWLDGVVVVTSSGNYGLDKPTRIAYGPANDPFVITVGALDLRNSPNPDRADVPRWSAYGYSYDGFAKPELSAPGRAVLGPIPAGSTLAAERPARVSQTPQGTYMRLSGTSFAAPIVSGIAADLLTLNPSLTPDQVKGALMLTARAVRHARTQAAGVGEVYAPSGAAVLAPPNPNLALDSFLVPDPSGGDLPVFDDAAWLAAAKASPTWDAASWLNGWSDTSWSLVSWSDVSWSDVSWSDVSWSDVSWSDVSWSDTLHDGAYVDVDP